LIKGIKLEVKENGWAKSLNEKNKLIR